MPYSKEKQAARMRAYRASKKAHGTALLPKALVRRLHRAGIQVSRYLTASPVSLGDYQDLERRLEAKVQRVEWQSSGIQRLQERIDTVEQVNIQLQVDLARLELMMDSMLWE